MSLQAIVNDWMDESRKLIVQNYDRDGMRASGKFERDLQVEEGGKSGLVKSTLFGSAHSPFIDGGRGATKSAGSGISLKDLIRKWIDDKRIVPDGISKDSLAFLIARKIHREGWKPKHLPPNGVISSVINEKRIASLQEQIGEFYKVNTTTEYGFNINSSG